MTIDAENLLDSIMESFARIKHIKPSDIPDIDLYMDQVTTFMDEKLKPSTRYPGEDKILTKTMINNYTKNDLMPPPVKKKYSKEHVLLLIFIYYFKGVLSINDIHAVLKPLTDKYFQSGGDFDLEDVYNEVFDMERDEVDSLMEDVKKKYAQACGTFSDAPEEDRDFLQKFSFICILGYDVYIKRLLIEKMIDEFGLHDKDKENKEK